ncbi:hypothetical protein [Flaviaesturariibacter aridisoli]|uniref:Uncharacterized protein n=1 Tax=Flaviaesturariibacter aridisoli TaxID=2545761 RepID=A0A4R4DYM4_9BACT|nr:hypothetical protein [Flaviaesturariibacter aridisoli]TCZ66929.1 hypothetical protein E0486_16410 [Flaviaesturariibacter aridisoli]
MQKTLLFACLMHLCSCSSGEQFRDLSEFNMNPKALKDGEPIKLIYADQGEGNNATGHFFSHLVVVSQESGDTVNILTGINNGFKEDDGDQVYHFISPANSAYKYAFLGDAIGAGTDIKDLPEPNLDYTKVRYDPDHREIARNNYPTLVGLLGTQSNTH